jgi:vacuolar-type H+-ATPase subunit H
MVIEAIEKIKKIEKENEERIQSAQKEAEKIIQDAKSKTEEIIHQARKEAEDELKKIAEIEEKIILSEIEKIKNEYLEEGGKIQQLAERNFKQAVEIVLKELYK